MSLTDVSNVQDLRAVPQYNCPQLGRWCQQPHKTLGSVERIDLAAEGLANPVLLAPRQETMRQEKGLRLLVIGSCAMHQVGQWVRQPVAQWQVSA